MLIDTDLNDNIITPFVNHKEKEHLTMSYGLDPIGYTVRYNETWDKIYPGEEIYPRLIETITVPKNHHIKKYIKSSYIRKGVVLTDRDTIKNISEETQKLYPKEGMFQIQFIHNEDIFQFDTLLTLKECDAEHAMLHPLEFCLVSTNEAIINTLDEALQIIPYVHNTHFKIYVAAIDPGYVGQLTFAIQNMSPNAIVLRQNDIIGQIVKHKLNKQVNQQYNGKYQNSKGIVRE